MQTDVPRPTTTVITVLLLVVSSALHAQQKTYPSLDLGVTYAGTHSIRTNGSQGFWAQGGGITLGSNLWHNLGIAADLSATHTGSVSNSGVPFSSLTVTFGPRYRWHAGHRVSVYGQGLVGEGDAFSGLFPAPGAAIPSTNSLAAKVGGGIDYSLSPRFAVRALEASWVYTQYLNGTDNQQNYLQLGAGLVLKFGRGHR
jgi:hypothetical protein